MALAKAFGFWVVGGCFLFCAAARAQVTIRHDPPIVEHKSFDPAHPPEKMPHLDPGEAAVTETIFNCAVKSFTKDTAHRAMGQVCQSAAKVDALEITLTLHVIVWLPNDAPQKLIAHEEGHRRIAEQIYKERADDAARAAAATSINPTTRWSRRCATPKTICAMPTSPKPAASLAASAIFTTRSPTTAPAIAPPRTRQSKRRSSETARNRRNSSLYFPSIFAMMKINTAPPSPPPSKR
jgi:hypothetical protein